VIERLRDKDLGVEFGCRVLGVSESAYHARKKRPKSARRLRDEQLITLKVQLDLEQHGSRSIEGAGVRVVQRTWRRPAQSGTTAPSAHPSPGH
jgi:hypothetical protein